MCFSVTNAKLDECERGRKLVSGDCHNLLSVDHSTVIFIGWQNLIRNASSTWNQIVYFKTPDVNGSRLISYWNLEFRYHRNFMTVSIPFGSCFPPCLQQIFQSWKSEGNWSSFRSKQKQNWKKKIKQMLRF